jgi:outer membrane protein assembly factor BamB
VYARETHSGLASSIYLHCAREGELKWSFTVGDGDMPDIGGPALGPDGTIYVLHGPLPGLSFTSDLLALTPSGELRWMRRLDRTDDDQVTVAPDGTVYVPGSTVRAISPQGQILWSHVLGNTYAPIFKFSALSGTGLLIVVKGENPLALDVITGDTVWIGPPSGGAWSIPPTVAGRTVWIKKSATDTYAFDMATGIIKRQIPDLDSGIYKLSDGNGVVPTNDGGLYIPLRNRVHAADTSGALRWLTPDRGSGVSEPVIDLTGHPFVQMQDGLVAYDPATGAQLWVRDQCRTAPIWHGGPALNQGGQIICTANQGVFAFSTTGLLRWSFQTTEDAYPAVPVAFTGAPAIGSDGTIYTWTAKRVYALWGRYPPEPASPWPMWRHDAQRTGRAW